MFIAVSVLVLCGLLMSLAGRAHTAAGIAMAALLGPVMGTCVLYMLYVLFVG